MPFMPYSGCDHPCQSCGEPLRNRGGADSVTFCIDGFGLHQARAELKTLSDLLGNELYDYDFTEPGEACRGKSIAVCDICPHDVDLPGPWGSGPSLADYGPELWATNDGGDDDDDDGDTSASVN